MHFQINNFQKKKQNKTKIRDCGTLKPEEDSSSPIADINPEHLEFLQDWPPKLLVDTLPPLQLPRHKLPTPESKPTIHTHTHYKILAKLEQLVQSTQTQKNKQNYHGFQVTQSFSGHFLPCLHQNYITLRNQRHCKENAQIV